MYIDVHKICNVYYNKICTVLQNVKLEQTKHTLTYTWVLRDFLWVRIYTWNTSSLVAAYCVILDSKWMVWFVICFSHDLEGNSPKNVFSNIEESHKIHVWSIFPWFPKPKKICHNHDPGGHARILSFHSSNSNSKRQKIHREKTTGRWNFLWNLWRLDDWPEAKSVWGSGLRMWQFIGFASLELSERNQGMDGDVMGIWLLRVDYSPPLMPHINKEMVNNPLRS